MENFCKIEVNVAWVDGSPRAEEEPGSACWDVDVLHESLPAAAAPAALWNAFIYSFVHVEAPALLLCSHSDRNEYFRAMRWGSIRVMDSSSLLTELLGLLGLLGQRLRSCFRRSRSTENSRTGGRQQHRCHTSYKWAFYQQLYSHYLQMYFIQVFLNNYKNLFLMKKHNGDVQCEAWWGEETSLCLLLTVDEDGDFLPNVPTRFMRTVRLVSHLWQSAAFRFGLKNTIERRGQPRVQISVTIILSLLLFEIKQQLNKKKLVYCHITWHKLSGFPSLDSKIKTLQAQ